SRVVTYTTTEWIETICPYSKLHLRICVNMQINRLTVGD
ncbi:MAG: hypothetical protein ACI8PB_005303, partial [Desulforhopalus sp.]